MLNKIYLHIGMNKTGSTSIQNYLASNFEYLKNKGFLYPRTGRAKHAHFGLSTALGFHNQKEQPDENQLQALKEKLLSEVHDFEGSLIFSSENFIKNKTLNYVEQFFRDYDVYIIIYLRRHDLWWESSYSQALKMVNNPPWDEGIENYINFSKNRGIGNYRSIVDRWAKVFGSEKIIVKPFEQSNFPNGLVNDFVKSIGFVPDKTVSEPVLLNSSLSYRALQFLEILQRLDVSAKEKNNLVNFVSKNKAMSSKDSLLSIEQRTEIYKDNIEDYEYIAKKYLNRKSGVLFNDLNFEKYECNHDHQKVITRSEICEIFLDYIKNC
ncbi:hypothetical protein THMIRHAM_05350 [Thiomicrorhabdus immobilis]|uniref:Sulfotransferase domain-containing protein n=1 Tax=Thiomicrorhabdus immobilis TaxID=2791037 RepID=A0ABM7MBJ7_9GAMM|nr:hypothetical protein [Thiomicrorhabdus immobilis]BCN92750.1 hypothetical protein THMIRHAM_05350 [Thiomicrorhabdus immobilis]